MPTKPGRRRLAEIWDACTTCRNRSVKCDKQKPECQRCLSSGRICLGYSRLPDSTIIVATNQPVRSPGVVASRQLFDLPENVHERRALDFFLSRTATHLSGWCEESFWDRTVLQLSHSQPAVRHALIAVSSAYEQMQVTVSPTQQQDRSLVFSNYNKAIQCLYQQNSGCPQSALIYLSTCLLFTCLEFLQGDTKAAMAHVVCGLNILHTFQRAFDDPFPSQHQPEIQVILDDIVPIFCRLSIFANLIGELTPTIHAKSAEVDDLLSFRSISDARAGLVDILNDAIRFVWSITPQKYDGAITTTEIIKQVRLEVRLANWWRQFEECRPRIRQATDASRLQDIDDALTILNMHFQMGQTFMTVLTSNNECDWDVHFAEFEKINTLAQELLPRRRDSPGGAFSFETEMVSPLYLVALKCRHPRIRREAVLLMEQIAKREGAIDSKRASRVARAIIKIEEAGLGGGKKSSPDSRGKLGGNGRSDTPGKEVQDDAIPLEENRIQYFFEPDSAVGSAARQGAGPYSLAYKTCKGMYQKTNLEDEGAGDAVAVEGHVNASEDESSTYKTFNIATTTYSQRL